jgi:hypothetical protein
LASGFALCLTGCAGGGAGPIGLGAILGNRNLAGAEPLFADRESQCLDSADQILSILYAPETDAEKIRPTRRTFDCSRIAAAFQYVITPAGSINSGLDTSRYTDAQRNEIIDALIAASNRKCTRYAALLKNADGAFNGGLSVGSIIAGGLGSFVGGAQTAKALAGSAAILSGSRAAVNEVYLSNLTIQVLAAAMEKGRLRIRQDITNREDCDTKTYTLSRGIEDAFLYHNACSLSAGLSEAALSIERSQNPGLEAMRDVFAQYSSLVKQASEIGQGASPTPVKASVPALNLDSVNTTNAKLAAAQASVAKITGELSGLATETKQLQSGLASVPPGSAADTARQEYDRKMKEQTAKLNELNVETDKRDRLAATFTSELQRLASAVTLASPLPVRQESRQCPFTKSS